MIMKKLISMLAVSAMLVGCLAGCGSTSNDTAAAAASSAAATEVATAAPAAETETATEAPAASAAETEAPSAEATGSNLDSDITVVSREEGSGTRGAFVELMKIQDDDGDHTVETAEISNSTSVVTQAVAGNTAAIGYISLGSLNDSVKAVKVDGVEPTVENIKAGSYAVSRPFEICYKDENLTDLGKDFISYIMSAEGQKIVDDEGYIAMDESAESYTGSGMSGNLSLNGSTSVSPLMEKLAEAYRAINPDVTIDIQQTGSGAGITATADGTCEIGMSSRALKDEELAQGITEQQIALDGIAVIVNKDNGVEDLSSEQIRQIFVGEVTNWAELG